MCTIGYSAVNRCLSWDFLHIIPVFISFEWCFLW